MRMMILGIDKLDTMKMREKILGYSEDINMDIEQIKTEQDYDNILRKIYSLMDAKSNSKEFVELDMLVTLVEVYDECHYKIEATG